MYLAQPASDGLRCCAGDHDLVHGVERTAEVAEADRARIDASRSGQMIAARALRDRLRDRLSVEVAPGGEQMTRFGD